MQRISLPVGAVLLAFAPLAAAIPDANGNLVEPGTAESAVSGDSTMAARLNYNVGFERFEAAKKLELTGASLKGAAAKANAAEVRKGFTEAREKFRTAAAADASMKEAWNLIGYTSRRLGDYEGSLQAYDKALALAPDYPEAIEYRAELFVLTGRLEEAKAAYAVLLKSSPSYAGELKKAMQAWVADSNPPVKVNEADRSAFAAWLAMQ
jgi:tetratricopeptide (TPR) repeat protein